MQEHPTPWPQRPFWRESSPPQERIGAERPGITEKVTASRGEPQATTALVADYLTRYPAVQCLLEALHDCLDQPLQPGRGEIVSEMPMGIPMEQPRESEMPSR